ncbi:MAG: CarD family transcriptional regulator [Oscillospiraceae bacterium]|nr:CarD family transcriptional regulator [Oscillospiraceae bacterium]
MFSIGDNIVHPLHGAGTVSDISCQRINGVNREYYVLRIPLGDINVMVPVQGSEEIGVRAVIDAQTAEGLYEVMVGIEIEMTDNWNRRYRENMLRLKSGNLLEVSKVVKGLMAREARTKLSDAERKMMMSAKNILISELVLALDCSYEVVEERVVAALA